jgi:hypothetical protein
MTEHQRAASRSERGRRSPIPGLTATTSANGSADDLIARQLAAAPQAVWTVLLRRAQDTGGVLTREAPTTTWRVKNVEEQRTLILSAEAGPMPDLMISCHVGGPQDGPATLTLMADFAAGTILQRWHRRRTADQLCNALIQDVADTLAVVSGNPPVRIATRRSQRGTVQLGTGTNYWSGELVDMSESGIAMSVLASVVTADPEPADRWVGKETLAHIRLAKNRVDVPVSVVHVTRRRHDYLIGLHVMDSSRLTAILPSTASSPSGLKLFHLPGKAAR